ncbi:hypothetical protein C2845_PM01G43970 [Panicum miliaceum]|uniref:DUF8039 domain-containing protein n=1 Tax=Panicum miliaceum TaxID=4540 RepID=A0A3L6TI84_PANMI|nr:hypothetical protein C2845_PM01G43970 [Panicum miliaceum]
MSSPGPYRTPNTQDEHAASAWSFGKLLGPEIALTRLITKASLASQRRRSCASIVAPGDEPTDNVPVVDKQRYRVDDITMQTTCELHVRVKNITSLVAYGSALPMIRGGTIHGMLVPSGYSIVTVEQIVDAGGQNENLELDFIGGKGEQTLGEALHSCILWHKVGIKRIGTTCTMAPKDPPSPLGPD